MNLRAFAAATACYKLLPVAVGGDGPPSHSDAIGSVRWLLGPGIPRPPAFVYPPRRFGDAVVPGDCPGTVSVNRYILEGALRPLLQCYC